MRRRESITIFAGTAGASLLDARAQQSAPMTFGGNASSPALG